MKINMFFDFLNFIPEIFLIFLIFSLLLFSLVLSSVRLYNFPILAVSSSWLSVYGLILVTFLVVNTLDISQGLFNNLLFSNYLTSAVKLLVLFFSILSIVAALSYLKDENVNDFEYIISLLLVIFGIFVFISALDLIVLYVSLEIQSLVLYYLVASRSKNILSTEAGLKYFILGSLSSIFFLFGFSVFYFVLGTTNLYEISLLNSVSSLNVIYDNTLYIGFIFILIGFFFKLAAAPFHMWAPDIYEGAPTSVSLFMSVVPKISFIVVLIKFIFFSCNIYFFDIQNIVLFAAISSVFFGSLVGIQQKKFKRLFIYSSIGNIGFILLGISSGTLEGLQNVFVYTFIYTLMSVILWTFYISMRLNSNNSLVNYITDISSLIILNPFLILVFVINFFSLAGIPPLVGFWTKFLIVVSALDAHIFVVSIVIALISVISVFYYLRVVKIVYFNINNIQLVSFKRISKENSLIISGCFLFLLFFMYHPDLLLLISYKIANTVY